ncbi:MAG TPA: hypothetical protein VGE52_13935, partial [Pirellulales bacterium]
YALGSASGLHVALYRGDYAARIENVRDLRKKMALPSGSFKPWGDDLTFIQHGIPIAKGYSGCPIVTEAGRVVGVQSSTLPDAPFVSFAVHSRHVEEFQWHAPRRTLTELDLANYSLDHAFRRTNAEPTAFAAQPAETVSRSGSSTPAARAELPLRIKLGGVEVDAPFVHLGYVERDAPTVISRYVQDKEWYTAEAYGGSRVLRLQQLLDRTELARIANPLLGLEMLVPKGYEYSAFPTQNPDGLIVTFKPPSTSNPSPPYDSPISVWLMAVPDDYAAARMKFNEQLRSGKWKPTAAELEDPSLFAENRDRYINATVSDELESQFVRENLQIRIEDDSSPVQSEGDVFSHHVTANSVWFRSNYLSKNSNVGHVTRMSHRDPVFVIAHFQFDTRDSGAFNAFGAELNETYQEYAVIAASISLNQP